MKRRHALALLAVGAYAPTARAAGHGKTLVIGRSSLDSAFSDTAEQVVREACRRAAIDVRIVRLPLLRSIEMANNGEIDGDTARTAGVRQHYPELIVLKPAVIEADSVVYGRDPALAQRRRAEIAHMSACVARGSYSLANASAGMHLVEAPTRESALAMAADARCDVAIVLELDAEATITQLKLRGRLTRWPYRWATEPLHLVLNARHAALAPRLSAALASMKADGTIDRYYTDALRRSGVDRLGPEPPTR